MADIRSTSFNPGATYFRPASTATAKAAPQPAQTQAPLASPAPWNTTETFRPSSIDSAPTLRELSLSPSSAPAQTGLPVDLSDEVGTLDFYRKRQDDFKQRNPDLDPPDYYMNYGDKYLRKFHDHTKPKLSEAGQKWLERTGVALQQAIEDKRAEDPGAFAELERESDAFRAFAYASHPDAYLNSGMDTLNPIDLVHVGLTPEPKDLLTRDGLSQLVETGSRLVGRQAVKLAKATWNAGTKVGETVRETAINWGETSYRVGSSGVKWVGDSAREAVDKLKDRFDW